MDDHTNVIQMLNAATRAWVKHNLGECDPETCDSPAHGQRCAICQERIAEGAEAAEMYDPTFMHTGGVVHADCGLSRGWKLA
ncbi:MAG: hypothetical protein EHM63_00350 [Actinobacteria bacterium]|nr:MAG: hypothetical protein EHM63_00350 [Actinomycetota bacterium]